MYFYYGRACCWRWRFMAKLCAAVTPSLVSSYLKLCAEATALLPTRLQLAKPANCSADERQLSYRPARLNYQEKPGRPVRKSFFRHLSGLSRQKSGFGIKTASSEYKVSSHTVRYMHGKNATKSKLKGVWHEIFSLKFFSLISVPRPLSIPLGPIQI
jgi:hypothetical protein